jgi:hypothetical protein
MFKRFYFISYTSGTCGKGFRVLKLSRNPAKAANEALEQIEGKLGCTVCFSAFSKI